MDWMDAMDNTDAMNAQFIPSGHLLPVTYH